jgi:ABC-type phosphate/phosphonate transport system ATPase subunit
MDASNRIDSRDDRRMILLLHKLFHMEQNLAAITVNRHQLDIAEGHCQRSLAYSKRFGLEGETKTTNILLALRTYCNLRQVQCD